MAGRKTGEGWGCVAGRRAGWRCVAGRAGESRGGSGAEARRRGRGRGGGPGSVSASTLVRPGPQAGVATDRQQCAVAGDETDPDAFAQFELIDRRPSAWPPAGHQVAAQALRLVAEPQPERPGCGSISRIGTAAPPGHPRHESALHHHREQHHHEDDVVDQRWRRARPAAKTNVPSRIGTAPLSPAHSTNTFSPRRRPTGSSSGADQQRPHHQRQQRGQDEADPPGVAGEQLPQVDGQAEHGERDDLAEAGQRRRGPGGSRLCTGPAGRRA